GLVAAEVDQADLPLVAAADVPGGDAPVRVPAAGPLLGHDQPLLGLGLRDLVEGQHGHEPATRRRRLQALHRHGSVPSLAQLSKSSILLPGPSFTIAFFQEGRRPTYRPIRFSLPKTTWVRTLVTLTLKISSTAWRTSTLLASMATWKLTWLCSSLSVVAFS